MSNKKIENLCFERSALFADISKLTGLLHGSWIERYSTCSRPECKCHQGQRHGPHYCLVVNEDGRQRQKYIPLSKVTTALTGLAQYKKLQVIVTKITRINLAIMKEETQHEGR
jgi:hypothetical protein